MSVQLFGHDPDVMRSAAAIAAESGADMIDLNMGCPVRKVCKTGAGGRAARRPGPSGERRAARAGSGLPVTVKLRSGQRPGDASGVRVARRLADEAGVAGIGFHPRHASQEHRGDPTTSSRPAWSMSSRSRWWCPGTAPDEGVREAFERSGAAAVMLARGSLGNPWRFERLLGLRDEPEPHEVTAELRWVIESAEDHLGVERAGRYLRQFYPGTPTRSASRGGSVHRS